MRRLGIVERYSCGELLENLPGETGADSEFGRSENPERLAELPGHAILVADVAEKAEGKAESLVNAIDGTEGYYVGS